MMKSLVKFNFLPNGLRWEEEIRLVKVYGEYGIFDYESPDDKTKNDEKSDLLVKEETDKEREKREKKEQYENSRRGKFDNNYLVKKRIERREGFNYDIGILLRFDCPCFKRQYKENETTEIDRIDKIILYKSLVGLNDTMSFVFPTENNIRIGKHICEKESLLFNEVAICDDTQIIITRIYTQRGKLRQYWNLQQWAEKNDNLLTGNELWELVNKKIEFIYKIEELKGNLPTIRKNSIEEVEA